MTIWEDAFDILISWEIDIDVDILRKAAATVSPPNQSNSSARIFPDKIKH